MVDPCLLAQGPTTAAHKDQTMGYTTEFEGQIDIHPPLNTAEIAYLKAFSASRRMKRTKGSYYVGDDRTDVLENNIPPDGQPGLWCKWIPNEDGTAIVWNGHEKFYDSVAWMQYLIDHFLGHGAKAVGQVPGIVGGHTLRGHIHAEGEEPGDVWELIVINNQAREAESPLSAHTLLQLATPPG